MNAPAHVILMAQYNEWMNEKLYAAASKVPAGELAADRKAFFGSLLGTLNHLVVTDTLWLKRFATHPRGHAALDPIRRLPTPLSLDQVLFTDLGELRERRGLIDAAIRQWAAELTEEDLQHVLRYANSKGVVSNRRLFALVMHFFNHQAHHRGQATTLLSQSGIDVGVTDLLALIPNE